MVYLTDKLTIKTLAGVCAPHNNKDLLTFQVSSIHPSAVAWKCVNLRRGHLGMHCVYLSDMTLDFIRMLNL